MSEKILSDHSWRIAFSVLSPGICISSPIFIPLLEIIVLASADLFP
jgi:hypothetical protein